MPTTVPGSPGGDFARLLETEERLEGLIAAAKAEAERIVRAAREQITIQEAALERELAEADAGLPADIKRRLALGTEDIRRGALSDLTRYEVAPDRLAALAREVVALLLAGADE
jgi:hypothetical protein